MTTRTRKKAVAPKPALDVNQMWSYYQVTLDFEGPFAAAIPKDPKEIFAMLEHRMPSKPPADAVPIDQLAQQVAAEVAGPAGEEPGDEDPAEEAPQPGWSTFKRDEYGLYYEGRCVRGHIKDCALQIAQFFPDIANFRAKLVNKTYVITNRIHLGQTEPQGTEQRFIQVMTRRGPRSSFKFIDYIESPTITFTIKVLNDGVIKEEHLRAIFEYGGTHGMGQERSQDWGRYQMVSLQKLEPAPKEYAKEYAVGG